jgi:hypothetical protein
MCGLHLISWEVVSEKTDFSEKQNTYATAAPPSIPSRNYFALISNFVEERI